MRNQSRSQSGDKIADLVVDRTNNGSSSARRATVAPAFCAYLPNAHVFTRAKHRSQRALRHLLLQSVASVALLCLSRAPALADCDINGNTVTCTGSSGALFIPPPPGPSVTLDVFDMLNGGITITGIADSLVTNNGNINGDITSTGGTNFTFVQNGSFGSTSINATSTSTNSLIVNPSRSVTGVTMNGQNNVIDNSGIFNTNLNLTATGENSIINRAGGQFNALDLTAPRNAIDNSGTFNGGMHFTSDSTNSIQNRAGGVINGITATGNSRDQINNEGQINGAISTGAGNDWYVNLGRTGDGSLFGNVDLGDGRDTFYIEGGLVTSPVNMGAGDDWAAVLSGTLSSDFRRERARTSSIGRAAPLRPA